MNKIGKRLEVGDVFEIDLGNNSKGYLQYIADDMTQLNSTVIRVFKKRYPTKIVPLIGEIVSDDVEFYAHITDIKWGEKKGVWKKIGKSQDVGDVKKVFFRLSHDDFIITTYSPNPVSKNWYIWRLGEDTKDVSLGNKLLPQSDIGMIIWPDSVKERMITGKYHGFYPKYEGEE